MSFLKYMLAQAERKTASNDYNRAFVAAAFYVVVGRMPKKDDGQ